MGVSNDYGAIAIERIKNEFDARILQGYIKMATDDIETLKDFLYVCRVQAHNIQKTEFKTRITVKKQRNAARKQEIVVRVDKIPVILGEDEVCSAFVVEWKSFLVENNGFHHAMMYLIEMRKRHPGAVAIQFRVSEKDRKLYGISPSEIQIPSK